MLTLRPLGRVDTGQRQHDRGPIVGCADFAAPGRSLRRMLMLWVAGCVVGWVAADAQVTLKLQPGSAGKTLAGSGADGSAAPGPATSSALGWPRGMAYDASGNLLVADARNNVVVSISPSGVLSVIAGNGLQGYSGDGGNATNASFNEPTTVIVDAAGNLYLADAGNHRVRKVSTADVVTTIAGTALPGNTGDGGAAVSATLRQPRGLALDQAGNLYIADTGNHRVREIRLDGSIVAVAGTGAEGDSGDGGAALAATFRAPTGLAVAADGTLLIADTAARRVRSVSTVGTITGYAATTRRPEAVAADAAGSVYFADAGNQVALHSTADGTSSVAGSGGQGLFAAGTPTASALDNPSGIALGQNGDVALADRRNHQVQRVSLPVLNFGPVALGASSAPQTVTLQNAGSVALQVLSISVPVDFALTGASSACGTVPFALQAGGACAVAVEFKPSAAGAQTGIAQVRISGGAPQSLLLSGTGTSSATAAASTTSLSSDGTINYAGTPVTFTSNVTGSRSAMPTGTVALYDGATMMMTSPLSAGTAVMATSALTLGQHTLHSTYSGDAVYSSSTSLSVTDTVVAAPDFTFAASAASYSGAAGSTIPVAMLLTPVNGTLNHTVTWSVAGLPTGATATFVPAVLTLGGNPASVTMTVKMPTTTSRNELPAVALAGLTGCMLLLRRRRPPPALWLALVAALLSSGCSGGFRGTAQSVSSGGPVTYNTTISATTTGVMGDALTHTVSAAFVVTP